MIDCFVCSKGDGNGKFSWLSVSFGFSLIISFSFILSLFLFPIILPMESSIIVNDRDCQNNYQGFEDISSGLICYSLPLSFSSSFVSSYSYFASLSSIDQGYNDDDFRPKIFLLEIGSNEYTSQSSHIHDISSPFDIYIYLDGYNEQDDTMVNWDDVQVFIQWSFKKPDGTTFGPFTFELLSPISVGANRRYHIPIPDQDGSIDINHYDMNNYYSTVGNTMSDFGAGNVYFYVWMQKISDPSIRSYYKYPFEQYTYDNQMVLTYVDNNGRIESTEPLLPTTEKAPVGLEGFFNDPLGTVDDVISSTQSLISNNPVLVSAVIGIVGGLLGVIYINNRFGSGGAFVNKLSQKQKKKQKR